MSTAAERIREDVHMIDATRECSPRCRHHPYVAMELKTAPHPILFSGRVWGFNLSTLAILRERKIWRCAVKNCPTVAAYRSSDMSELEFEP